jgi:AAA family ATP:ADP antiporter
MIDRISKILKLRPGEWRLALSLLLLLAINILVVELVQVVATAGFVSNLGVTRLPWVWIVDMVVLLIFGGLYSLVVDRMKRVHLVAWLMGSFALLYLIVHQLFTYGISGGVNYFLLFILADQQFFVFPLAFWALANDVYRVAEAKRLFPIIGAGYAFGSITGNSIAAGSAAFFSRYGGEAHQLLSLAAVLMLVAVGLLYLTFHNREVQARQSKGHHINLRESIQVGLDFFNNVPLFRYLAVVMLLGYLAYTIIQYHFLYMIDLNVESSLQFQSFFGYYRVALISATLLFQWLITSRLLERLQLKSSFSLFPGAILVAAAVGVLIPGLLGGALGVFLMELFERAWDQPTRKSLQGLIPDERRGRVTTFLETYVLVAATISACVFLLSLLLVVTLTQWAPSVAITFYLTLATVAAIGAIWASFRARSEYDQSMLNWRLSRRQRRGLTGVMEKLDL